MKKTIKGLVKLTRFNEYFYFVIVTTLLGVAASGSSGDWRLSIVLVANWLAVAFAFMINDIEDAPDDVLSTHKINRNPISAGLITTKTARMVTFIVGVISASLFVLLGTMPLIFGLFSLVLGYLYSFQGVRFKSIVILDILSHSLMLAGLQYLCGFFTYASAFNRTMFWPLIFVMAISIYGELYNEVRDIEGDRAAQLQHTAIILGEKTTQTLMLAMLVIAVFSGSVSLFFFNLLPPRVLLTMLILVALFTIPPILKIRKYDNSLAVQSSLHKPLERAAALALSLQYFLLWFDRILPFSFF